jgi:sugar phosphate isomerase/epimerase
MRPLHVLPSTTSHKHEALLPTLDVFARLGFLDLDLNLNHLVERGTKLDDVQRRLAANGQRAWIASGGWCDFFDAPPAIAGTVASVDRQASLAHALGAARLRLFFGRLPLAECSRDRIEHAAANIRGAADRHPDLLLMFENHDGASSSPDVCRAILERVDRPNVGVTFDPINFVHRGVDPMDALSRLARFVVHVHLKGYAAGTFCGFGEGEVDLRPVLFALVDSGYRGAFTVEYEGAGDRTVRLFESIRRAELEIAALAAPIR